MQHIHFIVSVRLRSRLRHIKSDQGGEAQEHNYMQNYS